MPLETESFFIQTDGQTDGRVVRYDIRAPRCLERMRLQIRHLVKIHICNCFNSCYVDRGGVTVAYEVGGNAEAGR